MKEEERKAATVSHDDILMFPQLIKEEIYTRLWEHTMSSND